MSDLFVDNIKHQSSQGSGTITLGTSGEKITTASGAEFSAITGQNYPAFEAYLSAHQSVSDSTVTKVQVDTESFDTDNCYDNSTNYRFTPNVAGKYFIYGAVKGDTGAGDMRHTIGYLYKNGSEKVYTSVNFHSGDTSDGEGATNFFSCIESFNGSSDYIELYGNCDTLSGGTANIQGNSNVRYTYFGAYRIGA